MLAGHGDFNGDGFDDLAIGIPEEDIGAINRAGAVEVLYGTSKGLKETGNQFWHQNVAGVNGVAAAGEAFGFSLAIGDFDGDGYDDLAIGVVVDHVGPNGVGGVNVIYGSSSGLRATGDQLWTQDSPGINGRGVHADLFGNVLAAGDFNGDGRDDLAIGVSRETVGAVQYAGAVNVIFGSTNGLTPSGDQYWTQDTSGINDRAEDYDSFGSRLAVGDFNNDGRDDLAIGVAGERFGTETAGAVNVIYGSSGGLTSSSDQFWNQASEGIGETAETNDNFGVALAAGDYDGDGIDDLAIGVPGENGFAGAVHVLSGSVAKLAAPGILFDQSAFGFTPGANFQFGSSLTTGDFDSDGIDDLAIGASQETVMAQGQAGAVYVAYGRIGGLTDTGAQRWIQHIGPSGTLHDGPEAGDYFGWALTTGDYDGDGRSDLVIGVFWEDFGVENTGMIQVLYGFHNGLTDLDNQFFLQGDSTDGNEAGDQFGWALG